MRPIDADALLKKMNLAIVMLKHAITDLDCEDDPELVMELKAYQDIRDGIKDEPTVEPENLCDRCRFTFFEKGEEDDGQ